MPFLNWVFPSLSFCEKRCSQPHVHAYCARNRMRCRLVPSTCVYRAIERSGALGTSEQGKVTWEIGRIMAFPSHGHRGTRSLAETAAACSSQSRGCGQSDYGWPRPRFHGLGRAIAPAKAHAVEYRYVVLGDNGDYRSISVGVTYRVKLLLILQLLRVRAQHCVASPRPAVRRCEHLGPLG